MEEEKKGKYILKSILFVTLSLCITYSMFLLQGEGSPLSLDQQTRMVPSLMTRVKTPAAAITTIPLLIQSAAL